jgi:hypothetical protein
MVMKKLIRISCLLLLLGVLTSATVHKYYVAVFQVEAAPAKKQLQITGRIFIDDLEKALSTKYGKKFGLASGKELPESTETIKKYIADKMSVKVNGKPAALTYFDREYEDDMLVVYYTVPAPKKITSVDVRNTVLFEMFREQQNMINANINNQRKSLLLNYDTPQGILNYY